MRDGRAAPWRIVERRPIHGTPRHYVAGDTDKGCAVLVRPGSADVSPYRGVVEEIAVALVPRRYLRQGVEGSDCR